MKKDILMSFGKLGTFCNLCKGAESDNVKSSPHLSRFDLGVLIFSSFIINLFALAVPLVTLQVYDRILIFHSMSTLNVLVSGVVVVVILDIILKYCRSSIIGWTAARYEHMAYTSVLSHLMSTKFEALKSFSHGELLQRISSITRLKNFYSGQALISMIDLPFVVIFLAFIWYLSGKLLIVPLVLLSVFALYAVFLARSMKKALIMRDNDDDKRINFVSEILGHVHTVKMLGLEANFQRRYEAIQAQNIEDSCILNQQNAQGYNAASLFTQTMMISMISVGALMVVDNQLTTGVLLACVLLSGRIMQPVQRALSFWINFQDYQLAKGKFAALIALPVIEKLPSSALEEHNPKGKLEIKNLHFSYGGEPPIFEGAELTLKPGKSIALLGPPGDGKTTLLKLITGLFEPGKGNVTIDGLEVSKIPNAKIADYVGYLSSQSDIFHGTIIDNLTGFRPELQDQALEIAEYLGIDKVVSKLAMGYQTMLFDGPADPITPGMKQRVTIGRVLIARPRLILFDFADKSLDKEGYNHLFKLLGQVKGQASMIIVSNDRNILHLAQEEYSISQGKIIPNDQGYTKSGDITRPLQELRA